MSSKVKVFDTFTGTNGTLLDAHSPDVGGAWTHVTTGQGSVNTGHLSSNKLVFDVGTSGTKQATYVIDTGIADAKGQMLVTVTNGPSYVFSHVFRYQDSTNFLCLFGERDGGGTPYWAVKYIHGASVDTIASGNFAQTITGVTTTLTDSWSGNTFTANFGQGDSTGNVDLTAAAALTGQTFTGFCNYVDNANPASGYATPTIDNFAIGLVPDAPTSLSISSLTDNGDGTDNANVVFTVDGTDTSISSYTLYWSSNADNSSPLSLNIATNGSFTLTNLIQNQTYNAWVTSSNLVGESGILNIVNFDAATSTGSSSSKFIITLLIATGVIK